MDWMRAYLTAGCFAVRSLVELEATWLGATETVDATQQGSCGRASMTRDKILETCKSEETSKCSQ